MRKIKLKIQQLIKKRLFILVLELVSLYCYYYSFIYQEERKERERGDKTEYNDDDVLTT